MKGWVALVVVPVASATAALAVARAEGAGAAPSRIVDRTVICTPVPTYGGLRDLDVFADPPLVTSFATYPAHIGVGTGPEQPGSDLVIVRARSQKPFGNYPSAAGVFARVRRCTAARASVPLSPKGLPGPPIPWGKNADCAVRGSILVRVRAVLRSPAPWRKVDSWYVGARKSVDEASLAVRSERSEPIAYIELDQKGRTKLWLSPTCS